MSVLNYRAHSHIANFLNVKRDFQKVYLNLQYKDFIMQNAPTKGGRILHYKTKYFYLKLREIYNNRGFVVAVLEAFLVPKPFPLALEASKDQTVLSLHSL